MRTAIRKHLPDFLAIIGLVLIAAVVGSVILGKQRLALPAWVPIVGKDFFEFEAEMSTAQAVTPGQGQTVNIAGVEVGEIASVKLRDGKAIIGMRIQPKYSRLYKDASVLLRPKTGLKDMVAEVTPGTKAAGPLHEGDVIPVSQTLPDVNLDEILAALDSDTRDYLQLLLNDGAQGLGSEQKGRQLAQAIRRLEPTAKYAREINEGLAERRQNLARVVHNFSLLTDELGKKDTQLANFVQNSNAVFDTLAGQDASLRQILQKLPGTLETTQVTLGKVTTLADVLGPTLEDLRPAARALAPSLRQTRPFLRETTPIIRDEIRPFTRAALPTVKELRPAMRDLAATTPDLTASFSVINRLLNDGRLQPTRRQGGGLPLLAVVGQPRRQRDLLHAGRARPDPPRPRRAVLLDRPAAGRGLRGQSRSSARSSICSTRRRSSRSARSRPPPWAVGGRPVVKDAPSFGKIAAMVLFALSCFGLLLFLWLAFGGPVPLKPKGYRFHTSFAEAGQLALEADVRISGVPVGKVKTITPDKVTGRADVEIQLRSRYAPLPSDARAILRQKTLLGETYVELTPGRNSAKPIAEGGVLPSSQVSDTVELDEILRAFDPKTRAAFQDWMQTQAQAIDGRGRDLNDALGNLAPFAEDTADIVAILNRQEGAVSRLIANTGIVFGALTERNEQLRSLIENSNTVFATTAARDEALKASFRALPTFEKESTLTFNRLTEFAEETDPLVTQLRPAARELSPTLQDLEDIAPDLKNLLEQLQPLIDASKEGFPAAEKTLEDLRPLVAQLNPATAQLSPAVEFIGLNKRELTSFFANTVAATQAKDPGTTLHYLRTSNPLNPENLAVYPNRLPSNRPNPYRLPGTFTELPNGLPVYEDRQCNAANLVPSITNTPLTLVNDVIGAVPTAVPTVVPDLTGGLVPLPPIGLPPIPQVPLTPEQATALIPDELLQRVQEFAFGGQSNGGVVPAPPCRKQGPFTFGGQTTQYPHVNARSGG